MSDPTHIVAVRWVRLHDDGSFGSVLFTAGELSDGLKYLTVHIHVPVQP